MFEENEDAKKAVKVLDKYDFSEILKNVHFKDVYDITDDIGWSQMGNEEIRSAFDDLTSEEAAMYFKERYKMYCNIFPSYYMSWNKTIKA